jgi:hypothetical protein
MTVSTPPSRSVPPWDTATTPAPPEGVRPWYRRPAYLAPLVLLVLTLVVSVVLVSGGDQDRQGSPDPYEAVYGTFEPISRSGRGEAVVALPRSTNAGILTMKVSSGRFDVTGTAANSFDLGSLIGWTGGTAPYRGSTAFGLSDSAFHLSDPDFGLKYLHIGADPAASWTLTVKPISSAAELPAAASGTGNAIFLYSGDASEWLLEYSGSGYFWVGQQLLGTGSTGPWTTRPSPQPLAVETGKNHRGTVAAMAGPSVVIIKAEGRWRVTAQ